jgi:hypothetical protein
MMKHVAMSVALLSLVAGIPRLSGQAVISGPEGPSPYNVIRGWHKPFSEPGFAFGGNSGVFAESIGINVLQDAARRVWRNCLYTVDGDGKVKERWTQWDRLCEGSSGPGPHRVRISPYDPERRVWVINETFHQIPNRRTSHFSPTAGFSWQTASTITA